MKMHLEREAQYLAISCGCFTVNGLSVWLLPFTVIQDSSAMSGIGYLLGGLFWAALLFGMVFFGLAWNLVRGRQTYQKWKQNKLPGIMGFFRSRAARVVDPLWGLSFAASIFGNVFATVPDTATLAAMSLTLITFYLHMICNGKVYRYITQKKG